MFEVKFSFGKPEVPKELEDNYDENDINKLLYIEDMFASVVAQRMDIRLAASRVHLVEDKNKLIFIVMASLSENMTRYTLKVSKTKFFSLNEDQRVEALQDVTDNLLEQMSLDALELASDEDDDEEDNDE